MKKVVIKFSMWCDMHSTDNKIQYMQNDEALIAHTTPNTDVRVWPVFLQMRYDREEFFGWNSRLVE